MAVAIHFIYNNIFHYTFVTDLDILTYSCCTKFWCFFWDTRHSCSSFRRL